MMKWFRKKKKSKSFDDTQNGNIQPRVFVQNSDRTPQASVRTGQLVSQLPNRVLELVFSFVCPHTKDETYEKCEQSTIEDRCMLCDLRDLSHCAQVSRRWRKIAGSLLYHSIRIDAVHYCEREDILAEMRKRGSFMNRNAVPEDTAQARLKFLQRTLHDNLATFAFAVQYLKVPYMTRETCKPDLARCANVCANLRYIDLPEGVFSDDPSCSTLKHEIQARCPDLRKMTYTGGSERSLEMLSGGNMWRNLEVLELSKLNMDATILRQALGALPRLHALKVMDMKSFDDNLFKDSNYLPPFPALTELLFENTPNITGAGVATYLASAPHSLKTLSFTETGVHPASLHEILSVATSLEHLSIVETVNTSFPAVGSVPLLQSRSLKTLHYEITYGGSASAYTSTEASYYAYLTSSLMSGGLPNLEELFVRDPDFPETLLDLAPPMPNFAFDSDSPSRGAPSNRFSSNNPFAKMQSGPGLRQELQVYSKGLDEMEWNFSKVQPPTQPGRRGSATTARPISSYGLSPPDAARWQQGDARRSVIVGNGFGGFLAVPADGGRPSTSSGDTVRKRGSQYDMWR